MFAFGSLRINITVLISDGELFTQILTGITHRLTKRGSRLPLKAGTEILFLLFTNLLYFCLISSSQGSQNINQHHHAVTLPRFHDILFTPF